MDIIVKSLKRNKLHQIRRGSACQAFPSQRSQKSFRAGADGLIEPDHTITLRDKITMEVLSNAPQVSDFRSRAEFESSTPESFFAGPPVLYDHSDNCTLSISSSDLEKANALVSLFNKPDTAAVNGTSTQDHTASVAAFVTSKSLILVNDSRTTSISISYPTILLHAIQSLPDPTETSSQDQSVYMQLALSSSTDDEADDEEPDSISLTLIPPASSSPHEPTTTNTEEQALTPAQRLFEALSTCSNLHPDPAADDDGEGGSMNIETSSLFRAGLIQPGDSSDGLPPSMPGSGGWITAENMHEFVDEEGNWIADDENEDKENEEEAAGAEELGSGAGTVRRRDDGEEDNNDENRSNGDTKWQRTG